VGDLKKKTGSSEKRGAIIRVAATRVRIETKKGRKRERGKETTDMEVSGDVWRSTGGAVLERKGGRDLHLNRRDTMGNRTEGKEEGERGDEANGAGKRHKRQSRREANAGVTREWKKEAKLTPSRCRIRRGGDKKMTLPLRNGKLHGTGGGEKSVREEPQVWTVPGKKGPG